MENKSEPIIVRSKSYKAEEIKNIPDIKNKQETLYKIIGGKLIILTDKQINKNNL